MKEIKASKPVLNKKKEEPKFNFDFKKIGIIFASVLFLTGLCYGGYIAFKPKPVPNWVNLSEMSTNGEIKHMQSTSFISKEFNSINFIETKNDIMYISLKKIDNKNSVWIHHNYLDFHCVSTYTNKCSITVIFDKNPLESFIYDGGSQKTSYLINSDEFINKLKSSKQVIIKVNMRKIFKDLQEKSNSNLNGKFIDYTMKEYTIKVSDLNWK